MALAQSINSEWCDAADDVQECAEQALEALNLSCTKWDIARQRTSGSNESINRAAVECIQRVSALRSRGLFRLLFVDESRMLSVAEITSHSGDKVVPEKSRFVFSTPCFDFAESETRIILGQHYCKSWHCSIFEALVERKLERRESTCADDTHTTVKLLFLGLGGGAAPAAILDRFRRNSLAPRVNILEIVAVSPLFIFFHRVCSRLHALQKCEAKPPSDRDHFCSRRLSEIRRWCEPRRPSVLRRGMMLTR